MLFLLFRLGSDRYALDAVQIAEILPLVNIKKIPGSHRGVAGVFNYRGTSVAVIDLTELILGHPAPSRLSTRIIFVRCNDEDGKPHLFGLLAENATETMRCEPDDFVPSGIANHNMPFLGPIAAGPRGLIQRIELDKLLPASGRDVALKQHTGRS